MEERAVEGRAETERGAGAQLQKKRYAGDQDTSHTGATQVSYHLGGVEDVG